MAANKTEKKEEKAQKKEEQKPQQEVAVNKQQAVPVSKPISVEVKPVAKPQQPQPAAQQVKQSAAQQEKAPISINAFKSSIASMSRLVQEDLNKVDAEHVQLESSKKGGEVVVTKLDEALHKDGKVTPNTLAAVNSTAEAKRAEDKDEDDTWFTKSL